MATTCVFVHGAWHGAWCFDRVLPLVEAAGVRARALDLPGHGVDDAPLSDLNGDVAKVRAVLDEVAATGDDVLLLGHSYGGAVITEAGAHDAVRHLVYLCAFALDDGESCAHAAEDEPDTAAIDHEGRPDLASTFEWGEDGTSVRVDPVGAVEVFYQDCDEATQQWAVAQLGPQNIIALTQQPSAIAWRDRPSTYAICTEDQAVHPDLQRILARRCTHQVEWPTGHSPFLARPELVANLAIDLATS